MNPVGLSGKGPEKSPCPLPHGAPCRKPVFGATAQHRSGDAGHAAQHLTLQLSI